MADTKIEGLDELIRAFAATGDKAIEKLREPSIAGAEKVLHRAKQKMERHYKTGDAFHSLKTAPPSKGQKSKYYVYSKVTFSKAEAHIVPLELGHRLIIHGKNIKTVKEVPVLRPAADESRDEVADLMVETMNKVLDNMGGRK